MLLVAVVVGQGLVQLRLYSIEVTAEWKEGNRRRPKMKKNGSDVSNTHNLKEVCSRIRQPRDMKVTRSLPNGRRLCSTPPPPPDDLQVSLQEAATELPNDHGEFESRFRDGFNEAYYDQMCSGSGACLQTQSCTTSDAEILLKPWGGKCQKTAEKQKANVVKGSRRGMTNRRRPYARTRAELFGLLWLTAVCHLPHCIKDGALFGANVVQLLCFRVSRPPPEINKKYKREKTAGFGPWWTRIAPTPSHGRPALYRARKAMAARAAGFANARL